MANREQRYVIMSAGQAAAKGLSVPADRSLHVIDTKAGSPVFSTTHPERAGAFQAAVEAASTKRTKADAMRGEAAELDEQAVEEERKAASTAREEGFAFGQKMALQSSAIALGGASAVVAVNELVGPPQIGNLGYGVFSLLVAALAGGAIASKYPRAGLAVGAALAAVGAKQVSDWFARHPAPPARTG